MLLGCFLVALFVDTFYNADGRHKNQQEINDMYKSSNLLQYAPATPKNKM